jgi:hypothetical protein
VEFAHLGCENPFFEVTSSHNETISFDFAQFLSTDIILDFQEIDTNWLSILVKDFPDGAEIGSFEVKFDDFVDKKRKEGRVDFGYNSQMDDFEFQSLPFIKYEAQLIDNELDYFIELNNMNEEDREEAKNMRNDYLEIKRKLASLFNTVSINERVMGEKRVENINKNHHLSVQEKILLSKVGNNHHSLKNSYVNFAKKASMTVAREEKVLTDTYNLFPLVEEGRSNSRY